MKKYIVAFFVLAIVGGPAFGREIDTKQGASFSLKTLTEFGVDLDDPSRYGLAFSVPELLLSFDLFGYQKVSNRLKSPDPVGFIDLTLGEVEIRFANLSQPDYNNPGQSMGFGFNDSASTKTGYFSPFYLQNVRSGILWGDWIIQLGVGGTDSFWDPWHRENTGYGQMASSWAYLDTRVQYQRPLIPAVIKDPKSETDYWAYDGQATSKSTGVDELATSFAGTMVGAQFVGAEFSTMLKVATNNSWLVAAPNGASAGLDWAYRPAGELKGFRILGSALGGFNQGTTKDRHLVGGGVKVGYDITLPRSAVKVTSVEPYFGIDAAYALNGGSPTALEAATGLTVHWPGMNGWGFDYLQGAEGRTGNVYSGATIAYKASVPDATALANQHHSLQLTWYNDSDGGLVNNVGSEFVAQWKDFTTPESVLMVTGYFDTSIPSVLGGTLVPWTKLYYDHGTGFDNVMVFGGLKLKKAVRNAEFGLTYQSRNLTGAYNSTSLTNGYGALGILKASVQINL